MKRVLLSICLCAVMGANAQTAVKKSSISTGGGSHTNGNMQIIYAIGETAISEIDQGTKHLSEGFVGPDILTALGVEDYSEINGLQYYPNPVENNLNFKLPDNDNYEIYVFDMTGKALMQQKINQDSSRINMQNLPVANYLVIVINKQNKTKKIIKIQKK